MAKPTLPAILVLALISTVGVVVREVVLIGPVILFIAAISIARTPPPFSLPRFLPVSAPDWKLSAALTIPLACGLLAFLKIKSIATQTDDYSFIRAVAHWAYDKPIPTYIQSYFLAYGPMIVLLAYNWRRAAAFLWNNAFMLVYLAAFVVLAWIGGADTERVLFWAMPVVYVLLGKAIAENIELLKSPPLAGVLVLTQLVSERVFWTTPDHPNDFTTPMPVLTFLTDKLQVGDLSAYHGNRFFQAVSLLQYLTLSVVLIWWLSRRAGARHDAVK
jgi:hypothetical protein